MACVEGQPEGVHLHLRRLEALNGRGDPCGIDRDALTLPLHNGRCCDHIGVEATLAVLLGRRHRLGNGDAAVAQDVEQDAAFGAFGIGQGALGVVGRRQQVHHLVVRTDALLEGALLILVAAGHLIPQGLDALDGTLERLSGARGVPEATIRPAQCELQRPRARVLAGLLDGEQSVFGRLQCGKMVAPPFVRRRQPQVCMRERPPLAGLLQKLQPLGIPFKRAVQIGLELV